MKRYIEVDQCFVCPYLTPLKLNDDKQRTLEGKNADQYAVCGHKEIKTGVQNDHYRRPIELAKIPDWCPLPILQI